MPLFKKYDYRCPVCLSEYDLKAFAASGVKQCPACKTILQPLLVKQDGYVKANWQDLRTLAIYASRWARIFDLNRKGDQDALQALDNVLRGLQRYCPPGAEPIVPIHDAVREGVRRVEVQQLGAINTGDNIIPISLKPNKDGKIVSPFYKKLL